MVLHCSHVSIVWHISSASQRSGRHSGPRCRLPPCAASPSTGTLRSSASLARADRVDTWSPVSLCICEKKKRIISSVYRAFKYYTHSLVVIFQVHMESVCRAFLIFLLYCSILAHPHTGQIFCIVIGIGWLCSTVGRTPVFGWRTDPVANGLPT